MMTKSNGIIAKTSDFVNTHNQLILKKLLPDFNKIYYLYKADYQRKN
jgi:hypothetical protein